MTKTIKQISCELLSVVVETNEDGRTVGLPYDEILRQVKEQAEGETSLNCLRWYATKIRTQYNGYQQYTLPQVRARSKQQANKPTSNKPSILDMVKAMPLMISYTAKAKKAAKPKAKAKKAAKVKAEMAAVAA